MANQSIEEFESLDQIPLYAGAAGLGIVGGAVYARLPDDSVILLSPGVDQGILQLTGDVLAGPGSGIQAATLADVAVTPGTYNSPTSVTVDAKGRVLAAVASPVLWPTSVPAGRLLYSTSGDAIGSSEGIFANGAQLGVSDAAGEGRIGAGFDSGTLASDGDPDPALTAFAYFFLRSRGTRALPTILQDGDRLGSIFFYGHDGVRGLPAGAIYAVVDGAPGVDDMPCSLVFATRAVGGTGLVERVRIKPNGAVVMGALTYPIVDGAAGSVVKSNGAGVLSLQPDTDTGITQLTGDVTAGPGSASQAATLAATAVTPGSYSRMDATVDAKGRLTFAANGTIAAPSSIGMLVDGGGSVITTGLKGFIQVPFACTITGWTILSADGAVLTGSIVFDVWMDTFANFPPVVGDSITASAKPTLTTAKSATSTTLTGWTTAIPAGSVLGINVDSVTTLTKAVLQLNVTRNL